MLKRLFGKRSVKILLAVLAVLFLGFSISPIVLGDDMGSDVDTLRIQSSDNWLDTIGYYVQGLYKNIMPRTAHATSLPDYVTDGTNDYIQFQAASDALGVTGGEIKVSAGNFAFDSLTTTQFQPCSHIKITGAGIGATIITVTARNAVGFGPIFFNTKTDIIIQDLTIIWSDSTVGTNQSIMEFFNCGHVRIERVEILNAKQYFINVAGYDAVSGVTDFIARDCIFISDSTFPARGITAASTGGGNDVTDVKMINCFTSGLGRSFYAVADGVESFLIDGCEFVDGLGDINIAGGNTPEQRIVNTKVHSVTGCAANNHPIDCGGDFTFLKISSCDIAGYGNCGIYVGELGKNAIITNNTIDGTNFVVGGGNGINASGVSESIISGNIIKNVNQYGIVVQYNAAANPADNNDVSHNTIFDDRGGGALMTYGIFENDNNGEPTNNTYSRNKIWGATTEDIRLQGTRFITDVNVISVSSLDLSGGATDILVYNTPAAGYLVGYNILYTEASSADAGVLIRVGRYQDGVALDDDYFDLVVSEVSKNMGYVKSYSSDDMTQTALAAGDSITVGTAGGKVGTGEVRIILKIALIGD